LDGLIVIVTTSTFNHITRLVVYAQNSVLALMQS
jgi:hypothetical protein